MKRNIHTQAGESWKGEDEMREKKMTSVMPLRVVHETTRAVLAYYIRETDGDDEVCETWFPRSVVTVELIRNSYCVTEVAEWYVKKKELDYLKYVKSIPGGDHAE